MKLRTAILVAVTIIAAALAFAAYAITSGFLRIVVR